MWNMARELCDSNKFELVNKVCLTYGKERAFSVDSLKKQIYFKYKPSEVVVLFELFGLIELAPNSADRAYFLTGKDTKCDRARFVRMTFP